MIKQEYFSGFQPPNILEADLFHKKHVMCHSCLTDNKIEGKKKFFSVSGFQILLLKEHSRFWSWCASYTAPKCKGFTWQHHLAFLSETANLHFENFAYSKISSSPLSQVFPKIRVKVLLTCAKFHTDMLSIHLLSVGRNPTAISELGLCAFTAGMEKTWKKRGNPMQRTEFNSF